MKNNTKQKWIIFYERNGIKYYLHRFFKGIERVRFTDKKYATFESVNEVNDVAQKIKEIFKIYYPNEKLKIGLIE